MASWCRRSMPRAGARPSSTTRSDARRGARTRRPGQQPARGDDLDLGHGAARHRRRAREGRARRGEGARWDGEPLHLRRARAPGHDRANHRGRAIRDRPELRRARPCLDDHLSLGRGASAAPGEARVRPLWPPHQGVGSGQGEQRRRLPTGGSRARTGPAGSRWSPSATASPPRGSISTTGKR